MPHSAPLHTACLDTPLGPITVSATAAGITAVTYGGSPTAPASGAPPCLAETLEQLAEYFDGRRITFSVPLLIRGTPFQTAVWEALAAIPFGTATSYRDLAAALGRPRAVRAVGAANARNPLNILIPCHRVLGAAGALTGYSGGLARKKWLLDHERRVRAGASG